MPTISAGDLTLLRAEKHKSRYYMSFLVPRDLWTARVNDGSITREETSITFDGGSGSYFSLVEALQEVWVGTSAGDDDIGRVRIRSISSGDGGVTGTLTVARNPLLWADDLYLTFKHDYPVRPMYSLLVAGGTFYKDGNIAYTDENEDPLPILIAGDHRAKFIDDSLGYAQFNIDLSDSYAVKNGASISSYTAAAYPSAGATVSFNGGTGVGYVRFSTGGQWWMKYTCTDSNGRTMTGYRCYFACSTDPTDPTYPFVDFTVNSVAGDWDKGGWQAGIQVHDNAALTDIPDRQLAILWQQAWYGDTEKNITVLPDNSSTVICGYTIKDVPVSDMNSGLQTDSFDIATVESIMRNMYHFSIHLQADQSPDDWWKYSSWLTIGRAIHHFWLYHSTVMYVADVIGLLDNTDGIAATIVEEGNLYSVADDLARQHGIRAHVVCDKGGRIHLADEVNLLIDSERAALDTAMDITDADISDEQSFPRNQLRRVAYSQIDGFAYSGTFDGDGKPNPDAYCAMAPGGVPDNDGPGSAKLERQVIRGQTHANQIVGQLHAMQNNPYIEYRVKFHGNYLPTIDIAYAEWFTRSLLATSNVREIVWTDKNLKLKTITAGIDVDRGSVTVNAVFETEVNGSDGVPTSCEMTAIAIPPGTDYVIPDFDIDGVHGALLTGSSIYYRSAFGKAWTLRTADAINFLDKDPFWVTKQASFSPLDAIILTAEDGQIRRSTDCAQNLSTLSPGNPPNDAGDSPAPALGDLTFIYYGGSEINDGYHVWLAVWQNGSSLWRSWILFSDDDLSSFNWLAIHDYSDPGISSSTEFGFGSGGTLTYAQKSATSPSHLLIRLSEDDDTYIGLSRQTDGGYQRYLTIISRTGETLTEEVESDPFGWTNASQHNIARLTDNLVLVATPKAALSPLDNMRFDLLTISGTTITNVGNDVSDVIGAGSNYPTQTVIVRESATEGFAAWLDGSPTGTLIKGCLVDCSTTTPTPGTIRTLVSGAANVLPLDLIKTSTGELALLYQEGAATKVVLFDADPYSLGTPYTLETASSSSLNYAQESARKMCLLDSNAIVAVYCNTDSGGTDYVRAVAFTHAGKVVTGGTPVTVYSNSDPAASPCIATSGNDEVAIVYMPTSSSIALRSATISGTTITLIANTDTLAGAVETSIVYTGVERKFVLGWGGSISDTYGRATVIYPAISGGEIPWTPGSDLETKVLGATLSKGEGGDALFLTGWTPDIMFVQKYELPALDNVGHYSLGSTTEAQLNAGTYVAYPISIHEDDNYVLLFGRINNPYGLGTVHVIRSDDGGADAYTIEDGWGTDLAGSVVVEPGGELYVIRNTGSGAKLYTGIVSLKVASTLIFPAGVNIGSFKRDWFDGTLYACADTGQSVMVISSVYPYVFWVDITYNHGVADGVNSLVIL